MKPIIGIIMRDSVSESGHDILYVYTEIINCIIKSGGIPIGIPNKYLDNYLDICKGFIMEGGSEFDKQDFISIKKIKEKDIPLLGICLGMQEMAYLANGTIKDINDHMNREHEISIYKDSLLYKILGIDKINVNSRHKSSIAKTNLIVSAYSTDGVIEAVEDKNNKFYVGLQWHPENMYDDINVKKIFDYFIKVCHDN